MFLLKFFILALFLKTSYVILNFFYTFGFFIGLIKQFVPKIYYSSSQNIKLDIRLSF